MKRLEAWLGSWHRENAALEAAAAAREKAPKGQAASTFHKAALLSGDPALHASAHHGAVGRVRALTTALTLFPTGPPGVGKTSTAKVLLQALNYDVVELNASDTRSQKQLQAFAGDMVGNTSIADFADGKVGGQQRKLALIMWLLTLMTSDCLPHQVGGKQRKLALIMDECDGMSAGDRGGMMALLGVIKASKMPIICICNDRQSAKVNTLA